ncbi:S8 family serine peptidase [Sporichthya sp.]|uniref:S8 family serine peptidase n=1 Tax=Sporichthya sp. TaxID=65475 RepID=UPI0018147E2F|nr:S8 family serine peptidase [Sporichthya sp.]MBA3745430.1 S8 family serine peptidase [Sporichthya sp.]
MVVGLSMLVVIAGLAGPAAAGDGPNPAEPTVAPAEGEDSERVPDRYLVIFNKDTTLEHIRDVEQEATVRGGRIHVEYTKALRGFGATLPKDALAAVKSDDQIRFVEADRTVGITSTQTSVPSWGLDRVDQRPGQVDGRYGYEATGVGVTAYIIDTGIRATHHEFGGPSNRRVEAGYNAVPDGRTSDDCNGHGTHTAATVGGATFGVAKAVSLVPVRVLRCDGGGEVMWLVEGIDWMSQQVDTWRATHTDGAFVANLSLGQVGSAAIDQAVKTAIGKGITFVAAAGNENGSACTPSPGRVPEAITVGAITREDERAGFSNYGSCVDIWAPGSAIRSAHNSSDTATITLSGTSMATPHVAGAAALYLERFPASTPAEVSAAVTSTATTGVLRDLGPGSPNKLLFAAGLGGVANRGPTMGTPVPFLMGGQATAGRGIPVKVIADAAMDPDGDAVTSHQVQRSGDGGITWSEVALPSARAASVGLKIPATGALRFRSRATDHLGHVGDWILGPTRSLSLREEKSNASFSQGGLWRVATPKAALGGAVRRTQKSGSSVTMTFTGSQASWIATMAKDRGKAAVYVDGKKIGVVDLYAKNATSRRTVFFITGLTSGKHKVKIVVLGTKRGAAKGHQIDVDGWATLS